MHVCWQIANRDGYPGRCRLFLLRAGFLRRWPLHVNCSLSGPQGRQDGINLAGRRRNASNAILGASAAACHVARNERHDGSPEIDFRGYHTHRQQWSGFFCLQQQQPGCRGVRGAVSLGPVYARHSAGDTNEPEAAQTQSGGETFHAGPYWDSGIRYARISSESETES